MYDRGGVGIGGIAYCPPYNPPNGGVIRLYRLIFPASWYFLYSRY